MHCRRSQCVSRLSCTKSWSLPRKFFRGTWCIADAINAFPGFLAPSLSRFRGIFLDGLGALSTQSMRFPTFLHQVLVAFGEILPGDLVHCRRNQCVSRLSCTKSWSLLGQKVRPCIRNAILKMRLHYGCRVFQSLASTDRTSGSYWRDMTEKKALHFTTSANAQANAATIAASMG